MPHHYHKTCIDWSPTRLYNPHPAIKLQREPTLTPSSSSSTASSATLTPTSPSPATTPPKTFLDTGILSSSPPSFSTDHTATAVSNSHTLTLPELDALHAHLPLTHLPCPYPDDDADDDDAHAAAHRRPSAGPLFHADAILVSCSSAYDRAHGTALAGVHFSASSPLNATYTLSPSPDAPPLTRQRIELLAGIKALERVEEFVRAAERGRDGGGKGAAAGGDDDDGEEEEEEEGPLSQVVVRTHSQYLVRGAAQMLPVWKERGWTNARGRVVANVDLFWYLDRRITWLEWVGVEVLFLLVGREDNAGAVEMVGMKGL